MNIVCHQVEEVKSSCQCRKIIPFCKFALEYWNGHGQFQRHRSCIECGAYCVEQESKIGLIRRLASTRGVTRVFPIQIDSVEAELLTELNTRCRKRRAVFGSTRGFGESGQRLARLIESPAANGNVRFEPWVRLLKFVEFSVLWYFRVAASTPGLQLKIGADGREGIYQVGVAVSGDVNRARNDWVASSSS